MEEIEESLTQLLEEEGNLICLCSDFLRREQETPSYAKHYIENILTAHRAWFDEIEAQLTTLENMK